MGVSSPPNVAIYEYDITETTPEPVRHVAGGAFAYTKTLGSGSLSDYLEFDNFKQTDDYKASKTKVLIFRTSDAGVTIKEMKFWMPDSSALGYGSSKIQFAVSGTWQAFPTNAASGQINMIDVPTTLPASQNVFRQDDEANLSNNNDENVSQYIYVNLILSEDYPGGRYGADTGIGRLEFRLTYDYE